MSMHEEPRPRELRLVKHSTRPSVSQSFDYLISNPFLVKRVSMEARRVPQKLSLRDRLEEYWDSLKQERRVFGKEPESNTAKLARRRFTRDLARRDQVLQTAKVVGRAIKKFWEHGPYPPAA